MDTNNLFRLADDLYGTKDEYILIVDQDGAAVTSELTCAKPEKFL